MDEERRRDRVWKQILNQVYRDGEVHLENIDVSLTETVNSQSTAKTLIDSEEYRSKDDITENPDKTYTVVIEPDASESTKRSVLHTMEKNRFGFLKKSENRGGVWEIGPWLQAALDVEVPDEGGIDKDTINEDAVRKG